MAVVGRRLCLLCLLVCRLRRARSRRRLCCLCLWRGDRLPEVRRVQCREEGRVDRMMGQYRWWWMIRIRVLCRI